MLDVQLATAWILKQQMAIKEINSQVNEQANAGLQQIQGQLAHMTPENFMFTLKLN